METKIGILCLTLLLMTTWINSGNAQSVPNPIGCYHVNKGNPIFRTSAGDYDADHVTILVCSMACSGQGFNYAALEGRACYCADDNYPDSAKQGTLTPCNDPCNGDMSESCGSSDYSLVFDVATEEAAIQLSQAEAARAYVTNVAQVAAVTATGSDLEFKFDFGDGSTVTEPATSELQPHVYVVPGSYVISATAENLKGISADAVPINVEMPVARADITCPDGVEVDMEFTCTLEVFEGSKMVVTFDVADGTPPWTLWLGSPSFFETGTCAQSMTLQDAPAVGSTVWVIPEAEFLNDGRVLAFETYISFVGDGELNLMILRPTCGGGDAWCPATNTCETPGTCAWIKGDADPTASATCSNTDVYCQYGTRCVDSGDVHNCPAETSRLAISSTDTPGVDYTVVKVVTRTVAVLGYNLLKLDDIATEDLPEVQVGDVLGFGVTTTGARIGYESVADDVEPVEFSYSTGGSATEGSVLVVADGGNGITQRHHIKAVTSQPATTSFKYMFEEFGDFRIEADIANPLAPSAAIVSTSVGVQSPVLDLLLEVDPPYLEIGNEATIMLRVSSGNPVNYTIDCGDGTIYTVSRQAESFTQADNITHVFSTEVGVLTINVTASNILNTEYALTTIIVQRPVIKNDYDITSDNPQIHPCFPCQMSGIIRFTVTLSTLNLATIGTSPTISISSGSYSNTTNVPITGLNSVGDSFDIEHLIRFPGYYNIRFSIFNLVSSEEYDFGQISIQNAIVGFTASAMYAPPLDNTGQLVNGHGPLMRLFPIDSPITVTFATLNGTGITVTVDDYGDSSPVESCKVPSDCRLTHKYSSPGTYTILVRASNDISTSPTESITVTMVKNIKGIKVSEMNQANAGVPKEFQIDLENTGDESCLLVDFLNDESIVHCYGAQATCSNCDWQSAIPTGAFTVSNVYDNDGSFKLKITGYNAVSKVEVIHAFAIIDFDCSVPRIEFVDPHPAADYPKKFLRSKDVRLEVITGLSCAVVVNAKRWLLVKVDPITREDIPGSEVYLDDPSSPYYIPDAKTTAVRIPPRILPIGIFKFLFVMTLDQESTRDIELSNSLPEYIEIEPAPLIIKLLEGETTSTIIGYGDVLDLEPGVWSIDPNIPEDEDQGFADAVYKYYVYRFYESIPLDDFMEYVETPIVIPSTDDNITQDIGGPYGTGPGRINVTSGTLQLNTRGMLLNMTHEVLVIANKNGREGKAKMRFTVKEGTYPQPIVSMGRGTPYQTGLGTIVINPTSDLRLKVKCNKGCDGGVTLEWSIIASDGTNQFEVNDWEQFATGSSTRNLFVSSQLFATYPDAKTYEFTVHVTNENGYTGKSHVQMEINKPPSGGTCNITKPGNSIIVGENIEVTCEGWEDSNGIEQMRYLVIRPDYAVPINIPVLSNSGTNVVTLEPPAGTVKIDYKMELWVELTDKLGAKTSYEIDTIEVRPNGTIDVADASQAESILTDLTVLIAKGNSREINGKLQTLASQLNDQRENQDLDIAALGSSTNDSNEFVEATMSSEGDKALRAYFRSKVIGLVPEISLDSLEDIQLAANSLSVCSSKTDELSQGSQDLMTAQTKRMLNQVLELGGKAPESLRVGTINACLDNVGNGLEGVHFSTESPLSMVDKLEAEGGDFDSLSHDIDEGRGDGTQSIVTTWPTTTAMINEEYRERKIEKARKASQELSDQVSLAQKLILSNQVAGEPETVFRSETVTSRCARGKAKLIVDQISDSGPSGGPTFPDANVLFENSDLGEDEAIDCKISSLRKNPRNYVKSSEALADDTNIQNVEFVKGDDSPIPVNNLKKPVMVTICRTEGKDQGPELLEFDPSNNTDANTGMSCHGFVVNYERLSVTLDFAPYNSSKPYEAYMQYLQFPTTDTYDRMFSLDSESPWYDPNTDMFSVFVDSSYIANNTGQYYVCIRELDLFDPYNELDLDYAIYNQTGNFTGNYSMRIVQSGCRYWDQSIEEWSTEGTEVDPRSDHKCARCLTRHLSSFASAWIVPPTPLDFNYIFNNADFADNLTIYITTIVVYVTFFFIFIWARRKDKKDVVLLGVTPLPDNNPKHKYLYEIVVCTGQRKESGTDSKVSFIMSGDKDETDVRTFDDNMRPILRRSGQDRFLMATPRPLGTLNYMRVWHDNSGKGVKQSWYLQYIAVRDLQTRERFYFICNEWFSLVEGDGLIDRLISIAGKEQMQSFGHVFYGHTRKNLNDGHIWFSIFARPAGSRFTRMQRAACCMMLLWMEMLVNIMWYKVVPPAPAQNAINIGPFSLSPAQVSIGVQSAIIVFPISLIVVQLFRKARPRIKRSSRIEEAKKEQVKQIKLGKDRSKAYMADPVSTSAIKIDTDQNSLSSSESPRSVHSESQLIAPDGKPEHAEVITAHDEEKPKKKKKKSSYPWWTVIIAWILTILMTLMATTFTIFYGIQMGNLETSEWLTSLVITFFTGILFTQPIKVIALATFIALVIKTPNADEDEDMDDDEEECQLANDELWLHEHSDAPKPRKIAYRPPDPAHIEAMREKRMKEIAMYSIIREIILYVIFLWVLLMISYGNIDAHAYIMKEQYVNTLVGGDGSHTFDKITTIKQFWDWVNTGLVPNLYASTWYNGEDPTDQDNYFGDRNAFIVGYPVMRQVRIKPGLCDMHAYFDDHINECNVPYSFSDEDEASYKPGWIATNATSGFRKEYTYTTWDVLDGYPFLGRHGIYIGGGYAVEMKEPDLIAEHMEQLYEEAWVDKYTRAVFVEFSTYNAQVNLFAVVNLVVEFLPLGGGLSIARIDVIRLLTYYEGFALVQLCCEVAFFIFIVFFIVKEVRNIKREKREYPSKFWNLAEWVIIGFSLGTIIVYFYRYYTTKTLLGDFRDNGGRGYVKLQYVAYWNELLGYMLGWVVFMAVVKFLKLLRFNKRMGILASTIRFAMNDLLWFALLFTVVFLAFSGIFYLILGREVYNYSDFIFAMESLITAILGKFDFKELVEAERVFGPVLFFLFMGTIAFVLINMFLTIINEAFQVVKHDINQQSNDFEMVDFMMARFKAFLGMGQRGATVNPEEHEAQAALDAAMDPNKSTVEQFPDKVDQLLNHIAKVYFNHDNFDDIIKSMGQGKKPSNPKKKMIQIT